MATGFIATLTGNGTSITYTAQSNGKVHINYHLKGSSANSFIVDTLYITYVVSETLGTFEYYLRGGESTTITTVNIPLHISILEELT
jgi:hypothetical protein